MDKQKCYDTKYCQLYNLQIEANQLRKDKSFFKSKLKRTIHKLSFYVIWDLLFIVCQFYEYDYD